MHVKPNTFWKETMVQDNCKKKMKNLTRKHKLLRWNGSKQTNRNDIEPKWRRHHLILTQMEKKDHKTEKTINLGKFITPSKQPSVTNVVGQVDLIYSVRTYHIVSLV